MENNYEKLITIIEYLDKIEPCFVFGIFIIGVIGNILSFAVFIFTKFK